jgi:integrase
VTWIVDGSKILQPDEMGKVLTDLREKSRRSINHRLNLIVFRLSSCAGLRASEIAGLVLSDVRVDSDRPSIRVRKEVAKGHKARVVPLTWDASTKDDLAAWKQFRRDQGAGDGDPFVCSQHRDSLGKPLERRGLRKRFKVACKSLGPERQAELTIHHGRHTFISLSLHGGLPITAVKAAAGHATIAVTNIYSHLVVDEHEEVRNLFAF